MISPDTALLEGARLAHPAWANALWLAPLLAVALAAAHRRSRRALRRLASPTLLADLAPTLRPALWRPIALAAALALIGLALSRPQHDPERRETIATGRDVLVVLDVSRSMLAQDLAPNRLERAKLWIRDLAASLESDRLALVTFAGSAVVKCPPTLDHDFFLLALDDASPSTVARGGTMIGDALRTALDQILTGEDPTPTDIILITDGEDQGSFPAQAARRVAEAGARIIAVGIGAEHEGTPIPDTTGQTSRYIEHERQTVRSRLDAQTLAEIAAATPGGAFLRVGTGTIELDRVYADLTRGLARAELGATEALRYREAFQPLLLAAFILLTLEGLIRRAPR